MKYFLLIAALLVALSPRNPVFGQDSADSLVKQAVAAQGGAELRGLKSLAVKGDAKFWEPGQAFVAGGEPRFLGDAKFEPTWDLAGARPPPPCARDQKYPSPQKTKHPKTILP